MSNAYELHDVDLLDARFADPKRVGRAVAHDAALSERVDAGGERGGGDAPWPDISGVLALPAARSAVDARGVTTVRWTDVRFAGGVMALDQPAPRAGLFTATVRLRARRPHPRGVARRPVTDSLGYLTTKFTVTPIRTSTGVQFK